MGACTITSKVCLIVISVAFWAVAGGFFFVGGYVYNTYRDFDHFTTSTITLIPATIMLVVGVVMFIIGCIGLLASCKESRFILACFFTMVLVILLMEVAAAILAFAFAYNVKLENAVKDGLEKAMENYDNDTEYRHEIDYVQTQLECCGVTNYTDWFDMPWNNHTLPSSCYKNDTDFYTQGCEAKLVDMFEQNLVYIAAVAIAFAALQVLGLMFTCILFCRVKEPDVPYTSIGSGPGGLTV